MVIVIGRRGKRERRGGEEREVVRMRVIARQRQRVARIR